MKRVEKDLKKLQAIYDVGVKDSTNNLLRVKEFVSNTRTNNV